MKKVKRLNFRLSEARHIKLVSLSMEKDKTITNMIDAWIDSLPEPKKLINPKIPS